MTLILASASPRRADILRSLGLSFDIVVPETDELVIPDEPRRTAEENARRKLEWCRARYPADRIIAADTVIDFQGRCLTKPASRAEAFTLLRCFSGKTQTVITAVALARPHGPVCLDVTESTVRFRRLDDGLIAEYFRRVDPMDKAGAYNINQSGDLIIESHTGSRTNIMGLPSEVVERWLRAES